MSNSFINIRKIKELAQKKINDLTDQSPINELEDLVKIVQLSGGGHLSADSDGDLPTTGMIAFDKQYDRFFYNKKAPKFRKDSTRPGGTVSDTASRITRGARRIDRGRRRRTSWSRKLYGRVNPTASGSSGPSYGGSVAGYMLGGYTPTSSFSNVVDNFSFASDANATDVGDMTSPVNYYGQSGTSSTHGYHMGGYPPGYTNGDKVEAVSYSSGGNMVASPYVLSGGQIGGNTSTLGDKDTAMYSIGSTAPTPAGPHIQKFALPVGANSTDVGDLQHDDRSSPSPFTGGLYMFAGSTSPTHVYMAGGIAPSVPGGTSAIGKFPMASDANSTNVGSLYGDIRDATGNSSSTHGYVSGGIWSVPEGNPNPAAVYQFNISKYSFASDGNSTDVGDTLGGRYASGQSSTTHGYRTGGINPTPPPNWSTNTIQKFPFASDADATDVGDLTVARYHGVGTQN